MELLIEVEWQEGQSIVFARLDGIILQEEDSRLILLLFLMRGKEQGWSHLEFPMKHLGSQRTNDIPADLSTSSQRKYQTHSAVGLENARNLFLLRGSYMVKTDLPLTHVFFLNIYSSCRAMGRSVII